MSDDMREALKPCPMCGGQARLDDCRTIWRVECTNQLCGALVLGERAPEPEDDNQPDGYWEYFEASAVNRWNNRKAYHPQVRPVATVCQDTARAIVSTCEDLAPGSKLYAHPPAPAAVPNWEAEAKRAFWTGLEIGASMGAVRIAPRWEEYIDKRKIEINAAPAQEEPRQAPEYTQGICQDGAAILKDGQMMTIEEILADLRGASR